MIPTAHPSWDVLDCTKLNAYIACPRKFFYTFVLGWKPAFESHDLLFGIAFHEALEHLYDRWKERGGGHESKDVIEAIATFLASYNKHYGMEDMDAVKNRENTALALAQYIEKWKDDDFEVLHTEVSGTVPIAGDMDLFFRLDTLCKGKTGYLILEHKTSKWRVEMWMNSWYLSFQAGLANHLLECLYPGESAGIIMNGIFFRKPPRFKKNGEPYANSGTGNEFYRLPIKKNDKQILAWLAMVQGWMVRLNQDMDIMHSGDDKGTVMTSFPCNPGSCQNYGRVCPYHDMCRIWANPLQEIGAMPSDFEQKYWDPRELDKTYTKLLEVT